mmetsp:Transcript_1780/g.3254  ORF Transcript_1780/g.3254 Transcript_1780/m.3254 type:complete len:82 (+) Transcript_1780:99-344(+)
MPPTQPPKPDKTDAIPTGRTLNHMSTAALLAVMLIEAGSANCLLNTSTYIRVGRNRQQHRSGTIGPASQSADLARCGKKKA